MLDLIERARVPRVRTMLEFAEQEITPATGPHRNMRFRADRQPFARLVLIEFDRVDDRGRPRWRVRAASGPAQDGKTLVFVGIPVMYHLFELKEDVILGAPTMEMARDKWRRDILPYIKSSRYAHLLPQSGAGSKGGEFESITFEHGPELKLMSAKGGDEKRSGYTARVIVMTEIDKMDEASTTSREADPVSQMKARAGAFGDRAVIYEECTISHEKGRINVDITAGSDSRMTLQCPHCDAWRILERAHLVGWQDAASEMDADAQSAYCCPACGSEWTEEERAEANRNARLVHKGQEVGADGEVTGPAPNTRTFGFRWNAANSLFKTASSVGVEEWNAQRNPNSESGERFMCQFRWTVPYADEALESMSLSIGQIMRRVRPNMPKGMVPEDALVVGVGVDLNKYMLNWTAVSLDRAGRPHVFDYGVHATAAAQIGTDEALKIALRELLEQFEEGWDSEDQAGWTPDQVWIDARWKSKEAVYPVLREFKDARYMAAMGYGAGQMLRQGQSNVYRAPDRRSKYVREIGDGYHRVAQREHKCDLIHVDANYGKTYVYERLAIPLVNDAGKVFEEVPDDAMTLYASPPDKPNEHLDWAKHINAEERETKFVEGKGVCVVWNQLSAHNHQFDSTSLGCMAARRAIALLDKPQVVTNYFASQKKRGVR